MSDKTKTITLSESLVPVPLSLEIKHVDSSSSRNDHVDADALILTTQLGILMQVWPKAGSLAEMCDLSDQVMKVLKNRREMCLKPTFAADAGDSEIDITPR